MVILGPQWCRTHRDRTQNNIGFGRGSTPNSLGSWPGQDSYSLRSCRLQNPKQPQVLANEDANSLEFGCVQDPNSLGSVPGARPKIEDPKQRLVLSVQEPGAGPKLPQVLSCAGPKIALVHGRCRTQDRLEFYLVQNPEQLQILSALKPKFFVKIKGKPATWCGSPISILDILLAHHGCLMGGGRGTIFHMVS